MAPRPESKQRPGQELSVASRKRREADSGLSMSERLARLHYLCKQMTEISGSARRN